MSTVLYQSTDTGAPELNGTTGSLITLLDAVLVTGYGTQQSAGWAKSFSGTNKAVYRPALGSRFYLRIDDNGSGSLSGREARARGYETMSDIDTGEDPFPTIPQAANGLFISKSYIADTSARDWKIVADGKRFVLFIYKPWLSTNLLWDGFWAGDIVSNVSGDAYGFALIGRSSEGTTTVQATLHTLAITPVTISNTHFLARAYDGVTKSVPFGKGGNPFFGARTSMGASVSANHPYPNAADNKLIICPISISETAVQSTWRGTLPGIYDICHTAPLEDGDTFSINGETFIALPVGAASYRMAVKTSAWE